jgi:hypothetical protein
MSHWIPSKKDLTIEVTVRTNPGHNTNEGLSNAWLKAFAAEAKKPLLIVQSCPFILDNHDSHITEASTDLAKNVHLHVFGLPKNSRSTTIFGPFKQARRNNIDKYGVSNSTLIRNLTL